EFSKLNAAGGMEWSYDYGVGIRDDIFFAGEATPDGGFIFSGNEDITQDSILALVAKCDGQGQLQWMKSFSGKGIKAIHVTHDGSYIAAGGYAPNNTVNAL